MLCDSAYAWLNRGSGGVMHPFPFFFKLLKAGSSDSDLACAMTPFVCAQSSYHVSGGESYEGHCELRDQYLTKTDTHASSNTAKHS